jgi:hypothetical protein
MKVNGKIRQLCVIQERPHATLFSGRSSECITWTPQTEINTYMLPFIAKNAFFLYSNEQF